MEIHEEFRIKINDPVRSWCYYPPLDVIVYEGNGSITIIEAATGCINKTFNFEDSLVSSPICIDVVGKQKLAMACGNVFNCRSKFNDVLLCDSILQTTNSDCYSNASIDLPMPEALMLLDALKTVPSKWENRLKLGFQCSLDLENEDNLDIVWKWNLVTFNCPSTVFLDWLTEINMELNDNFPSLPLISSVIYRIKCLQLSDYDIRLSIYDRFKEVMNIEANRFLSFEIWPHKTYKWATPELMAKVGFYHHPRRINDDRALCFLCNICLITWEATDEPWSEHQRHSPSCPLFKQNYTSNVPLSITEATTTAQKQNSANNITLIAKSTGNRYVATISEDGHICIWDTCYLFRKILEFDTPVLSKDGSISIDSACLIDNPLLIKYMSNDMDESFPGFHIVLCARFVPDSDSVNKYLQPSDLDGVHNNRVNYIYNQQLSNQEASFLIVIDVDYQFSLISQDEKITLPEYSVEEFRMTMEEDMHFEDMNDLQQYPDNVSSVYKELPVTQDEQVNVGMKYNFFSDLSLFRLWHESKTTKESMVRSRDIGDTSIVQIIPLIMDYAEDFLNDSVRIASVHPLVVENDEESYESESGSSVYLMVNIQRDVDKEDSTVGGALSIYRFQVDGIKETGIKPSIKIQHMSSTVLKAGENVENLFPISFESLESNCSESSSTANADEIPIETMSIMKSTLSKSSFYWLLLTSNGDVFLFTLPLNQLTTEPLKQSLSEIATKIHIKKELPGNIRKLLLFSDMDRLCLLTDDGVMGFYTIVPRKKSDNSHRPIEETRGNLCEKPADVENSKPNLAHIAPIVPDPLVVDQDDVVDRLNLICDFIQYEIVTSRMKLSYGCNWIEVSPLEIIDFKSNVNNFINVSRCFNTKSGVQSEPPLLISGSPFLKVADQPQCCTRTLNFRSSQACSREQIIEFSTAKQLCLGHVDLRVELYDKMNKNSNLIYVTLLRQQKFNGPTLSKELNNGSLKVNTSSEANMIINDLEAPFIDDDMAQYYDEVNSEILRKMDGEIVAGPYLLNKYCQSDSTSVFLSMTSAELLKCRSRHYAIHIRVRCRGNSEDRKSTSSSLNMSSGNDRYSTCDSTNLNIKSISLTMRKFAKPILAIRNERSQRLAILRNHKFLKQIFDLLTEKAHSKIPKPLMLQNCLDILNWIVVMYLNDIKPHSEKIHRIISIATDHVYQLIHIHLIQGDRYTSKMIAKILSGLLKLESRYWSLDNRPAISDESSYFILSRSVHNILQSNIDWLLLSENSVAIHNYLLILDQLDQLSVTQQSSSPDNRPLNYSLVSKLSLLSLISKRFSETMSTEEDIYLRTILGYPHNPLTGDLFDVVNDGNLTEPVNTLHWNLTEMYSKKPAITLDGSNNDSISKYLMHTFHDHSLKHIQEQINEQINSMEEKVTSDFSIQDLQKVYHKMVMTNVSNNIQLMSPDLIGSASVPSVTISETPEQIQSNISNMTWPGFDPFLLSKMNPKQIIYSDMKKKLKSGHSSTISESFNTAKTSHPPLENMNYKINPARKSSILEVDVLPVFFESGSEGTFLETCDYSDQPTKDSNIYNDFSPNISIPLMHMMDGGCGLPATPKTTPAITTQTTPMQNSPVQSPSSSIPAVKSEILETSSLLLDDINQQRLKFSQFTNNLLTNPCSYHIVVNRLHANARRHVILDLRQSSLITDILIPACDKLQKIIVRISRNKNEEEMQTVVVHSRIATEPLLLLNIQPIIICNYVQVIIIAKSNITATRNRINIGHLYGRPAILPWEICNEISILPNKTWSETIIQMLDQLRPQTETIAIRYAMTRETLKHLLNKCVKTGINQNVLSQAMSDYHPKSKLPTPKPNGTLSQLINQVNSVYNKCCQLQQQLSIMNNQMKQYQTLLLMTDPDCPGQLRTEDSQRIIELTTVDKLRVLMEFLLESLLLDKATYFEINVLQDNMKLISGIMTNVMWYGNREMQIMIVSWIPKLITKSNDISQAIKLWCHDWLLDFLLNTFTNRNISLLSLNKEEIFSFICVIFQRLSNAGYHYQLLQNILDILALMLQPHQQSGNVSDISYIDIELLNWMMLLIDFTLSWIDSDSMNVEEPFNEWKFLFWNKMYNTVDNQMLTISSDVTKDKMNFLKQTLVQLNTQKEAFVDYIKKGQYDPWFSQLIMNEYMSQFVKLSLKINGNITKMKKSISVNKIKKAIPVVKNSKRNDDVNPLLLAASHSIATTIKLMLNTLQCMDFQVSQDTFILTCMILTKLFVLVQQSGLNVNDYIEKDSIHSIIERAFKRNANSTIGLDVYSLHACKLLLSEIVLSDIRSLAQNSTEQSREELRSELQDKVSLVDSSNPDDNTLDNDSVDNDEDEYPYNDEEDVTPTGADDEELTTNADEPFTLYITHLGNIAKQKAENIKNNEESPSDEYVDIVEEFDFLGQPSAFIPTYHKAKFPKEYPSAYKPTVFPKQIIVNSFESIQSDKQEEESSHSVLYYDLRLENTIFTHQEIMFNHSCLNWMHQIRVQLYSQIPPCPTVTRLVLPEITKNTKPLTIAYVFESISQLLEDETNINFEELVIFLTNICHHLQREKLLGIFDSLDLCSVSLESVLDVILQRCSDTPLSLSLYCQLICFLLDFSDYTLKRCHFQRIFQLTDSLQCQELNEDVVNNFRSIVVKSLENLENNADFFLEILYNIVENCHKCRNELRASGQLASVIMECSKLSLVECIQRSNDTFINFITKIVSMTKLYLYNPDSFEERKCFTSLIPKIFTNQLLQIEKSLISKSTISTQVQSTALVQLNLLALELIMSMQEGFLSFIDGEMLKRLMETMSYCTSNILESSKLSDVTVVSDDLVRYSQNISIGDIVWRQLVRIAQLIIATSQELATELLNSLLTVLQKSLPTINEPLFLLSIWLLKNVEIPSDQDVDYSQLLTAMISVIVCCSDMRLSNAPVNTVTTRLAIAKMHRFNSSQMFDQMSTTSTEGHISNSSRLNVAPFCKIFCNGNDSSDPHLLVRLLDNHYPKSSMTILRTNRVKPPELNWSYDFFPHETNVEVVVMLPCDMIVHKIVLHPKSVREFSSKFELTLLRQVHDRSTVTHQRNHRSVSNSDGVLIDNINSNQLSNKIIFRFEKPLSSKLVLSKMEVFTINQWWDHRFQVTNDMSNLCVFRCLHLFNYLIGITSSSTTAFINDILPRNTKFFNILLNWNQLYSSTSEQLEIKLLNKSICSLIGLMLVDLGQRLELFSSLFINEILAKVSLLHTGSMNVNDYCIHFTNEISMMELNIFYYLLTLDDNYTEKRLKLVLGWFAENVMKEGSIERNLLIYHDSVASIVYLLSVVLCRRIDSNLCHDIEPQFITKLQKTIVKSSGYLKKALYRLLCSVCSVESGLYQELITDCLAFEVNDSGINRANLQSILWASRSVSGSKSLKESDLLPRLIKKINRFLTIGSISEDIYKTYDDICYILKFLAKLCLSGCSSIKVWLGTVEVNYFWSLLLDYLINDGRHVQHMPSILKMKLINASVKFFRAVTLCCEDNQTTFVRVFIESMERYKMRSDTIVLSNPLRQLIIDVIVKEPHYNIVVTMSEPNSLFKQFPGWLISSDELGRCRLSFKHPGIGHERNCILIDKYSMTSTVSTILSDISNQMVKQKPMMSPEKLNTTDPSDYRTLSQQQQLKMKSKRQSITNDISSSLVLSYNDKILSSDTDLFDLLSLQESEEDFTCGCVRISCSVKIHDKSEDRRQSPVTIKNHITGHLLVKFTEQGGMKLLSMMMPLLYTDIRRVSSISGSSYRPTTTSVSNSMGFIDDEMIVPTEINRVVKTLPLIPAHSITALCLFLQIDLYPLYLIRQQQYRSALIHLLLGITDDECGVSLIQTFPQLQCLPFIILSDLLQDPTVSQDKRDLIVNQCIDLGLIDFFINLLSILGHVDSGISLNSFKSNGPWASFISQSLCDLHYQLFSPTVTVDKPDARPVAPTGNSKPSSHMVSSSMDPKSPYITFMPFIDEKKNYWAKGTGFGTGGMYSTWDSEYVLLRQRLEETNASAILDTLSTLISSSDEDVDNLKDLLDHNEDSLPIKVVESIYQSTLLSFVCCYLRNDSVLDVSQHVNIYKSVLRLIRSTAKHRSLHYLLFPHLNPLGTNPDFIYSFNQISSMSSVNVSQLLFQLKICVDTYINRLKKAPATAPKSAENTRRLTRQFSIRRKNTNYSSFLQRINDALKTSKDGSGDTKEDQKVAESENLTLLIPEINGTLKLLEDVEQDIVERNKKYEADNQKLSDCNNLQNGLINVGESTDEHWDTSKIMRDIETRYMELMKKLQFGMFEMISPVSDENGKIKFTIPYHFKKNVENAVTSQSSAASLSRARRLAQETVTLSTSLPLSYSSSVFVRCDENHLDIMKVIIIGPPDTPYANGCFEFDVYFPPDYPKTPPLLNLQTTGNGSVRFNPNLYNEGKVCLSILNTWHGRPEERWSSRTSSFLQVLVSIQSLILVSEPYFNEPGYERSRGTPSGNNASKAYSANIQAATSRWAILEMMKNPPLCFADVIKKHFLLKKDEIVNQIQSWIDIYIDPSFDPALFNNTRPSIANSVQNLKKNLCMIKKEYDNLAKEDL